MLLTLLRGIRKENIHEIVGKDKRYSGKLVPQSRRAWRQRMSYRQRDSVTPAVESIDFRLSTLKLASRWGISARTGTQEAT